MAPYELHCASAAEAGAPTPLNLPTSFLSSRKSLTITTPWRVLYSREFRSATQHVALCGLLPLQRFEAAATGWLHALIQPRSCRAISGAGAQNKLHIRMTGVACLRMSFKDRDGGVHLSQSAGVCFDPLVLSTGNLANRWRQTRRETVLKDLDLYPRRSRSQPDSGHSGVPVREVDAPCGQLDQ